MAGIADLNIGETACDPNCIEPLPFVKIDEPTISMNFMVNDSPFAGKEGKYVTSRNLRDRLFKEVETNVSMRVRVACCFADIEVGNTCHANYIAKFGIVAVNSFKTFKLINLREFNVFLLFSLLQRTVIQASTLT